MRQNYHVLISQDSPCESTSRGRLVIFRLRVSYAEVEHEMNVGD